MHRRISCSSTIFSYSRPPPRLQKHFLKQASLPRSRSIFSSLPGAILSDPPLRRLTQTKLLRCDSRTVFDTISDISSYPNFVPFAISSTVTSKDAQGYPKSAILKVGYSKFGLEEDWESKVDCDPTKGTIEARSSDAASDGLFEVLKTKWQVSSINARHPSNETNKGSQTSVRLDIEVKFRNPLYDQMFSQVEGKVANAMIAAFEQRVDDLGKEQQPGL